MITRDFRKSTSRLQGFSLTELLVVVAIIGILATIGYPQYQQYSRAAKRVDARAALTQLSAQQERYYSNVSPPAYATALNVLGYTNAVSPDGYWTLSITNTAAPGTVVTLVATAGGNQSHVDPECTTLTLTTQGTQGSTGTGTVDTCWN